MDWKNKKVLISGHTGFKGAWLTLLLQQLGARVYGFALPAEKNPVFAYHSLGIKSLLQKECLANIVEPGKFADFYKEIEPDFVFHLAAQALVRKSYRNPLDTIQTNIIGTANVLDTLRIEFQQSSRRSVAIIVTTDKCYENKNWDYGYRETDRLGGSDIYSMSKASCEMLTEAYRSSFLQSYPLATVRAGNVIGGGDFAEDRIIPDCVRAFQNEKPIELRHPEATRPWQHVLEPLTGYLTLAEHLAGPDYQSFAGAWNFGPQHDQEYSVKLVVERFFAILSENRKSVLDESRWISVPPNANSFKEASRLKLTIDKAKSQLNWSPKWGFDETVSQTALWYQKFFDTPPALGGLRDYSIKQLEQYWVKSK